jgi:hypothetical protein
MQQYQIFLEGADTTSPQSWLVEIRQVLELVPEVSSFMTRMASPAPARDDGAMRGISAGYRTIMERGLDMVDGVASAVDAVASTVRNVAYGIGAAGAAVAGPVLVNRALQYNRG